MNRSLGVVALSGGRQDHLSLVAPNVYSLVAWPPIWGGLKYI